MIKNVLMWKFGQIFSLQHKGSEPAFQKLNKVPEETHFLPNELENIFGLVPLQRGWIFKLLHLFWFCSSIECLQTSSKQTTAFSLLRCSFFRLKLSESTSAWLREWMSLRRRPRNTEGEDFQTVRGSQTWENVKENVLVLENCGVQESVRVLDPIPAWICEPGTNSTHCPNHSWSKRSRTLTVSRKILSWKQNWISWEHPLNQTQRSQTSLSSVSRDSFDRASKFTSTGTESRNAVK